MVMILKMDDDSCTNLVNPQLASGREKKVFSPAGFFFFLQSDFLAHTLHADTVPLLVPHMHCPIYLCFPLWLQ